MLRTCLFFLFLSAASAQDGLLVEEDEILVERTDEAVIVRSPTAKLNFLFRVPPGFREAAALEPWKIELQATKEAQTARLRLRVGDVTATEGASNPTALARAREQEYCEGYGKLEVTGEGARRLAKTRGEKGERWVLLVRDGNKLYELFMETEPAGSAFGAVFQTLADGFTLLDPKGAPASVERAPEEIKARTIEHDYYRLKVFKPSGFTQEGVNPDKDKGIWLHLRRVDQYQNLCDIRIRVFLSKTIQKTLQERAQVRGIDRFAGKYHSARVPKKPTRGRWPGAKKSFRLKMVGKLKSGLVIQEEYRFIEHENDRTYEIQLTTYAGAQREFKQDIAAFWKKLKIRPK